WGLGRLRRYDEGHGQLQPQQLRPAATVGQIASYATYPDYHVIIKNKLIAALREIQVHDPAIEGKIFVDTSPVLERSYARMAGLGWIGKNTMLINKNLGSYFFLGGLALNIELEPDAGEGVRSSFVTCYNKLRPPFSSHQQVTNEDLTPSPGCGACERCLKACPTQCLAAQKMDASRCVSYLTIEKKTLDIDPDLAAKMGNWIFGCDVCQQVCPYNKNERAIERKSDRAKESKKTDDGNWKPKIAATIELKTILNWSEKEYQNYFAGLPVLRAKWPMFLRNALIATQNFDASPSIGVRSQISSFLQKT
ncbi:MAG: DUF1730 domain-containing protein, partial [Elusimicrobia bacterium]|nr:DUF1730 domain-containing protein [Elusimicrobiota bacterium]